MACESEEEVHAVHAFHVHPRVKRVVLLGWIGFALYVLSLPFLSMLFNDVLNFWEFTCFTPAEKIICAGGKTLKEVLKHSPPWAQRRAKDGKQYGCYAGQGVFPEWQCPVIGTERSGYVYSAEGFTLSYYLGTPPATGMMAALSAYNIGALWWYGVGNLHVARNQYGMNEHSCIAQMIWLSLRLYTFFYFLFLTCTFNVFGHLHMHSVYLMFTCQAFFYFGIVWLRAKEVNRAHTAAMNIVLCAGLTSAFGMSLGFLSNAIYGLEFLGYGFMYAESFGLICLFGITPAQIYWFG